jgi:hypothetical protein
MRAGVNKSNYNQHIFSIYTKDIDLKSYADDIETFEENLYLNRRQSTCSTSRIFLSMSF